MTTAILPTNRRVRPSTFLSQAVSGSSSKRADAIFAFLELWQRIEDQDLENRARREVSRANRQAAAQENSPGLLTRVMRALRLKLQHLLHPSVQS